MQSPKKFQVFVSSTYLDMQEERQTAVRAILDAGHIPAGMELFTANDKSQWETIKNWIDESDVFLLILGGRYGSIENESQKSYIELEYDYAIQKNKPFFAVVISETALDTKLKDKGTKAIEVADSKKLQEFRDKVKTKMVTQFDSPEGMELAIHKSLKHFEKNEKIVGWVRPTANNDFSPLLDELKRIKEERDLLHKKLCEIKPVALENEEYESLITILNDEKVDISLLKKWGFEPFLSHAGEYLFEKYSYSEANQIPDTMTLLDLMVIFRKQFSKGVCRVTSRDRLVDFLYENASLLATYGLLSNLGATYFFSDKGSQFLQYALLKKNADPKSC